GIVGERDRLFLVAEGDRGDHRSEDLLARDRHVVPRPGEERGLDVVSAGKVRRPAAAASERRAFPLPPRHVAPPPPPPPPPRSPRAAEMSGPIPTPGSRGSPTVTLSAAATSRCMNAG